MNSRLRRLGVPWFRTLLPLLVIVLAPSLLIGVSNSPELITSATTMLIMMIMVVGLQIFCGNSGVLAFGHAGFAVVGA
jgi:branched-chain amino acid transport system permease protein